MSKPKTPHAYELELRKMIKHRTGADMEPWLMPQVRATAMNMVMIDKIQSELMADTTQLADYREGSTGQMKFDAHPLMPHYDKYQRTLLMQLEALGLNYSTTPSKVKEDTRRGIDEKDPLTKLMQTAKDAMEG